MGFLAQQVKKIMVNGNKSVNSHGKIWHRSLSIYMEVQ
jgi:hypothetical protein